MGGGRGQSVGEQHEQARTNLGRTGDPTRALHFADQRVTHLQKIKSKQSLGISRVGEETNKLKVD